MNRLVRSQTQLAVLVISVLGCASSQTATPDRAANLPRYDFAKLTGTDLALKILDHRAEATDSAEWVARLTADFSAVLSRVGVHIVPSATTVLEVRLLQARSDFESQQWKGCSKVAAELSPVAAGGHPISVSSDRCVTKSNLWGNATASRVLAQAYQDSLAELLSDLDRELR
jgi:hypothetical protein